MGDDELRRLHSAGPALGAPPPPPTTAQNRSATPGPRVVGSVFRDPSSPLARPTPANQSSAAQPASPSVLPVTPLGTNFTKFTKFTDDAAQSEFIQVLNASFDETQTEIYNSYENDKYIELCITFLRCLLNFKVISTMIANSDTIYAKAVAAAAAADKQPEKIKDTESIETSTAKFKGIIEKYKSIENVKKAILNMNQDIQDDGYKDELDKDIKECTNELSKITITGSPINSLQTEITKAIEELEKTLRKSYREYEKALNNKKSTVARIYYTDPKPNKSSKEVTDNIEKEKTAADKELAKINKNIEEEEGKIASATNNDAKAEIYKKLESLKKKQKKQNKEVNRLENKLDRAKGERSEIRESIVAIPYDVDRCQDMFSCAFKEDNIESEFWLKTVLNETEGDVNPSAQSYEMQSAYFPDEEGNKYKLFDNDRGPYREFTYDRSKVSGGKSRRFNVTKKNRK
jgi:hypothetical protein